MNPRTFLVVGGWSLILLAILGAIGIIGPTPDRSLFGDAWVFNAAENWAHAFIGILGLMGALTLSTDAQKLLVGVIGLVAVGVGIWGFFVPVDSPNFFGANLEHPLDTLLNLGYAFWAWLALRNKQ